LFATSNTLFICPQCGKYTLAIHRKTYEKNVIAFCSNCHLNSVLTPTKDANYDMQLTYKEFIAQYNKEKNIIQKV